MSNSKEWESLKESIKKFIKGRWFPLIIGIALAILAGLIMAFFGWRITYIPELENSWDAISAIAAWVSILVSAIGVIASFVAIWYAIQVPKKIADRQDKIALFEKRYECFQTFEKCHIAYQAIKDNGCKIDYLRSLSGFILQKYNWCDVTEDVLIEKVLQYEYMIHQMQFLFPDISQEDGRQLYISFKDLLYSVYEDRDVEHNAKKYTDTMETFIEKYAHEMIVSLDI